MSNQIESARAQQFKFLDDLRESRITNMFGAAPYVANEFSLPIKEARQVLSDWMTSFNSGTVTGEAK